MMLPLQFNNRVALRSCNRPLFNLPQPVILFNLKILVILSVTSRAQADHVTETVDVDRGRVIYQCLSLSGSWVKRIDVSYFIKLSRVF